jgi:hypothetical protein
MRTIWYNISSCIIVYNIIYTCRVYNIVFYFIFYFVFENNDAVSPQATMTLTHSTERGWSSASVTVPRVSSPLAPKPRAFLYNAQYTIYTPTRLRYNIYINKTVVIVGVLCVKIAF